MKFKYYQDPGHGWLAVKVALLQSFGIAHLISACSYVRGATVYLEEDGDMNRFFEAYKTKHGVYPEYESRHSNGVSPIRSYECFNGALYEGPAVLQGIA